MICMSLIPVRIVASTIRSMLPNTKPIDEDHIRASMLSEASVIFFQLLHREAYECRAWQEHVLCKYT
jgi:hypothetical protein